jgi:DNA-directed RNA polymerase specialized sigma54-like protein
VGVASRSLEECLLIQLKYHGHKNPLVERMITEFMSDLEKRNFAAIAKKAEVTIEEVGEALKIVQSLDPRPARNFGAVNSIYITPDIYVHKVGDEYVIVSERRRPAHAARLSKYYKAALSERHERRGEERTCRRSCARRSGSSARVHPAPQRTIYKVMESILKFQHDFFDKGIEHLKPLILRDVAEDIGMHESTISRVTSNKYVHTPQRHLRAEVLLQQLDRPQRTAKTTSPASSVKQSHQAADRSAKIAKQPLFRSGDRRDPRQGEDRDRAAHGGEVPRVHGNPRVVEAQEDPLTMGLRGARAGDRPERRSPRGESE